MKVTLDLPDPLYRAAADHAAATGGDLPDLLRQALTIALATLTPHPGGGTEELETRAARSDPEAALAVLRNLPDAPPDPHDVLPPDLAAIRDGVSAAGSPPDRSPRPDAPADAAPSVAAA